MFTKYPELIERYQADIESEVWVGIVKEKPELIQKYKDLFTGNTWAGIIEDNPKIALNYGDNLSERAWDRLARYGNIIPEVFEKYINVFSEESWQNLIKRLDVTKEQIMEHGSKFSPYTWRIVYDKDKIDGDIAKKYYKSFETGLIYSLISSGVLSMDWFKSVVKDMKINNSEKTDDIIQLLIEHGFIDKRNFKTYFKYMEGSSKCELFAQNLLNEKQKTILLEDKDLEENELCYLISHNYLSEENIAKVLNRIDDRKLFTLTGYSKIITQYVGKL